MPSPETPADTIRRAAALIRQRAKFATDGPWTASPVYSATPSATSAVYSLAHPTGSAASEVVASGRPFKGGIRRGANAEHIASWHPTVALAVADWLDSWDGFEFREGASYAEDHSAAVRVARAYLGEVSGE